MYTILNFFVEVLVKVPTYLHISQMEYVCTNYVCKYVQKYHNMYVVYQKFVFYLFRYICGFPAF